MSKSIQFLTIIENAVEARKNSLVKKGLLDQ